MRDLAPLHDRNTLSILASQNKEKNEASDLKNTKIRSEELKALQVYNAYSNSGVQLTDPALRKQYLHGLMMIVISSSCLCVAHDSTKDKLVGKSFNRNNIIQRLHWVERHRKTVIQASPLLLATFVLQ